MFKDLKRGVRSNFNSLEELGKLFTVKVDRNKIWEIYLEAFSEDTRQGHNCNSCKSFLRQYSGVVGIVNYKMVTIWDDLIVPEEYKESIKAVNAYIHSLPIHSIWLTDSRHCGVDSNKDRELNTVWDHFYFLAPKKYVVNSSDAVSIEARQGNAKTTCDMYMRALTELTQDATDTVLELISQNSIYRGKEFKNTVVAFNKEQIHCATLTKEETLAHAWIASTSLIPGVTRIRNSAIGTLIIDLSEGMNLNKAVGKFEQVVAPTNYKRTTALVTPGMIKAAKEKLEELGLMDSLDRRHATLTDVKIDDLLFIDKSSELTDAFSEMSKDSVKTKPITKQELDKVQEITIEKFISDVLPKTKSLEVYLENKHLSKFVTLVTGENPDAVSWFKWDNLFSWSYTGGITDSIKERVKSAGGQINGELRISLSWHNTDDLDLWVITPSGKKIFYNSKLDPKTKGKLDVDMNAHSSKCGTNAVENIIFPLKELMETGTYTIKVDQYSRRSTTNTGYTVQVEHEGNITNIVKKKSPVSNDTTAKVFYNPTEPLKFDKEYSSIMDTKEKWGLKTNGFIKVKQMMLSPNFWTSAAGNKHFMFMLEDCKSDEIAKPFFNEFLNNTFVENRKVFELLADKFSIPKSEEQLSGIGFSETVASELILRVEGKFKRLIRIKF